MDRFLSSGHVITIRVFILSDVVPILKYTFKVMSQKTTLLLITSMKRIKSSQYRLKIMLRLHSLS